MLTCGTGRGDWYSGPTSFKGSLSPVTPRHKTYDSWQAVSGKESETKSPVLWAPQYDARKARSMLRHIGSTCYDEIRSFCFFSVLFRLHKKEHGTIPMVISEAPTAGVLVMLRDVFLNFTNDQCAHSQFSTACVTLATCELGSFQEYSPKSENGLNSDLGYGKYCSYVYAYIKIIS